MLPLFSISIICKNEECSLPALFQSHHIQEFIKSGGEIIVVDTGSTDKTIDILKSFGFSRNSVYRSSRLLFEEVGDRFIFNVDEKLAEKINHEFLVSGDTGFVIPGKKIFNFGAARSYAASRCSNDWILSLDCDEIPSHMHTAFINHIINTGDVDQISFNFTYRDSNGGVQSKTMRDKLYNKNVADWRWVVHEQVKAKPGHNVRPCTITEHTLALDHFQHPAEHRSNYLVQMCVDVLEDPNDQHIHWLGRELAFAGRNRSAIKLLKKHLKDENAWGGEKCFSCIYIGNCYMELLKEIKLSGLAKEKNELKMEMKIIKWYLYGLTFENNFREPLLKAAERYLENKKYSQAFNLAFQSLRIPDDINLNYCNYKNYYRDFPYFIIYTSLMKMGDFRNARSALEKALSYENANSTYNRDVHTLSLMEQGKSVPKDEKFNVEQKLTENVEIKTEPKKYLLKDIDF